jgi:phage baseplate assembly protein V
MIDSIFLAIKRMVGRGRGIVESDGGPVQLVQLQLSSIETRDQLPRIAEYGFQSCPPDGFTGVALFFGGDRSSGVVIATQHQQYRFQPLGKGEVALSDNLGQSVYLSANGIKITDKAGSTFFMNGDGTGSATFADGLTINANTLINGTLTATGNIVGEQNITATENVADQGGAKTMSGMRSTFNSHDHGGVQPGSGTSSGPDESM